MSTLKISNLSKTYSNGVKALDNVNLELENGMFGLLGPNGAGKSSLMRTLATLQEADNGTAFLDDIDILNQPAELRKVLGYLPQEFGVYPRITAEQLLSHLAVLPVLGAVLCGQPGCRRGRRVVSGLPVLRRPRSGHRLGARPGDADGGGYSGRLYAAGATALRSFQFTYARLLRIR